jgi:hypothetical protein
MSYSPALQDNRVAPKGHANKVPEEEQVTYWVASSSSKAHHTPQCGTQKQVCHSRSR